MTIPDRRLRSTLRVLAVLAVAIPATAAAVEGDGVATTRPHLVARTATEQQAHPRPPTRQPPGAPTTAVAFVRDAAQSANAQAAFAKLALERASDGEVRRFAQRMLDDEGRASSELTDAAKSASVDPPTDLNPEQRATRARLTTLSGPAFDREYLRAVLHEHDRQIALVRGYAATGGDEGLKSWAARFLPVLRRQQQLASPTAARLGT